MYRLSAMAHYQSPATFCEVSYDSDWYDDRHLTPYRYSLVRSEEDSNSDTVSLTLPSHAYYEYLKSFYDCRTSTSGQGRPNGYQGHYEQSGRAPTWHAFGRENQSDFGRQHLRSEPTRIRPTYAFPSLHLMQGGDSGDEADTDMALLDRTREKLVWVDALNKWVPQHQLQPRPYMSFVGNPPTVEKLMAKTPKEPGPRPQYDRHWSADNHLYMAMAWQKPMSAGQVPVGAGDEEHCGNEVRPCKRYEAHMERPPRTKNVDLRAAARERLTQLKDAANEKREAVKKRAQELAEQKKQRKAYSTPLYTPVADRHYKKRLPATKSTPVSPVQEIERRPATPKQVWQEESRRSSGHSKTESQASSSLRKEISITLVPKEVLIQETDDDDKLIEEVIEPPEEVVEVVEETLDKKATLSEEVKDDKPKKKKKKDETETAEEREARLAEQRLIESLEKQKKQQLEEQQRILREQQEKENQRQERERQAEEARLRQLKERKQPLGQSNHDNTNTAAGLLFPHKPSPATSTDLLKTNLPKPSIKPDELAPKPVDKSFMGDHFKLAKKSKSDKKQKGSKDKKKAVDKIEEVKVVAADVVDSAADAVTEKAGEGNGEEADKHGEVPDGELEVGPGLPTPSQGKRRKGKGEGKVAKPKPVKVEKPPKKTKVKAEPKEKPDLDFEKTNLSVVKENSKETRKAEHDKKHLKDVEKAKNKVLSRMIKPAAPSPDGSVSPCPVPKRESPSKAAPMLAGTAKSPPPIPAMSPVPVVQPEKASGLYESDGRLEQDCDVIAAPEQKLPVSQAADLEPDITPSEEEIRAKSPQNERRKSILEQRQIIKKEKRESRRCSKKEEEIIEETLPEPELDPTKVASWIFDSEDFSGDKEENKGEAAFSAAPLPAINEDLTPEFIEKQKREVKEKKRKTVLANLIGAEKSVQKWRKPGKGNNSYNDELRRLELAEERRKKQMEMFEKLKNRRTSVFGEVTDDGSPRFEDYEERVPESAMSGRLSPGDDDNGFLAKYCIFTKGNIDMYRHAFDAVDEDSAGWLEGEDVMIALRGVNNKLTEAEEEYLYRILELTGYKITHGADFKMFSVLAALSQRISSLDHWMKNVIGKMDFKTLEMKMFKCKTLWECNVDEESNSITLDQLCVELRAGGVSLEHELEVREKLSHLHALDLLDFLTYVPLFIMIHESVVSNPLDDSRSK